MGRIREHIKVNGKKCWTLFDSGARNTYVVPAVASRLLQFKLPKAFKSALGGSIKKGTHGAELIADIEGHKVYTDVLIVDEIGKDEEGKPIEILFGALAMQRWGIRLVPAEERLDMTHFPEEFVEF